jgi:dUTP pyrophosphatase
MPPDEHLELHIRSSYGMKYGLRLANGVGIIDADYYNNPDNEGEILVKLINDGERDVFIMKGDRFCQGIFTKHYLTDNDNATGERVGGVGSTK